MIIIEYIYIKVNFWEEGFSKVFYFFLIIFNICIINIVFKKINFFVRFNDIS